MFMRHMQCRAHEQLCSRRETDWNLKWHRRISWFPSQVRFMKDLIYTYVGDILVAVNPFKKIESLYGANVMAQCKGKKVKALRWEMA
jgi:hypothetical protein